MQCHNYKVISRRIQPRLEELLHRFPAVALLGPRQVGKTTLALALHQESRTSSLYLDLELPSDRAKMSDPELYLAQHEDRLVILDEIHRLPRIFQTLRGLIDRRRRKGKKTGQFLLLGSASMDLLQQSAESLAGRIAYIELGPFSVPETGADATAGDKLWVRGGFPDSFLAANDVASFEWRTAFIQTYLERDVPALGPRVPAETLRRFWQMLAHNQGQMLNAAQLAAGLGVTGHTVGRYLDIMVDLLLVRRLQPWSSSNAGKRLVRSPKVYVRDSGLVHALLGISEKEELLGHPVAGLSWEGMMVENIVTMLPSSARPWFYRTAAGAEIDLVIEFSPKKIWAIEIKRSISNPAPGKGFYLGSDDIKVGRRIVIYPGEEAYRIDAATEVMPLSHLLKSRE